MGAARDPVPFSMPLAETEVSVPGPLLEIPQHGTGDHLYSRWLQRGVKAVYEGPRMESPRESVISARNSAGHSNSLPAAIILAQGFKRRMFANLIRAGLATAQRENIKAGSLAVGRVRIMRPVDGRSKVDHADRRYVRQEPYERPSGPS